jgi:cobalt-zinc-cadmium efflux system protein
VRPGGRGRLSTDIPLQRDETTLGYQTMRADGSGQLRAEPARAAFIAALILQVSLVAGEALAGWLGHSIGLIGDAAHGLADVAAVGLALVAAALAARRPTPIHSFGFHRYSVLASAVNFLIFLGLAAATASVAIANLGAARTPSPVTMVVVGLVAGVLNGLSALLLEYRPDLSKAGDRSSGGRSFHHRHSHDLNRRALWLHLAGDGAGSILVAAVGVVIWIYPALKVLDPLTGLAISLLVAGLGVRVARDAVHILLDSTPSGLDIEGLKRELETSEGVDAVHDLHTWSISPDIWALSAHVVVTGHPSLETAQGVGQDLRRLLSDRYRVAHSTLQLECEPCDSLGAPACAADSSGPGPTESVRAQPDPANRPGTSSRRRWRAVQL